MTIFASLNPHISGEGQLTPTKFGTSVETQVYIFAPKHDGIGQTIFAL